MNLHMGKIDMCVYFIDPKEPTKLNLWFVPNLYSKGTMNVLCVDCWLCDSGESGPLPLWHIQQHNS